LEDREFSGKKLDRKKEAKKGTCGLADLQVTAAIKCCFQTMQKKTLQTTFLCRKKIAKQFFFGLLTNLMASGWKMIAN
jgi:hypothetical protein